MKKFFLYATTLFLPYSTGLVQTGFVVSPALIPFYALITIFIFNFRKSKNSNAVLVIVALTWSLTCLVSVGYSPHVIPSISRALVFLSGAFLFCVLISIKSPSLKPDEVANSIMFFGISLSAYYIVNFVLASVRVGWQQVIIERYVGGAASLPWGASNVIAATLFIPLVVGCIRAVQGKVGRLPIVTIFICMTGILLTFSRTSAIMSFALLAAFFLFGRRGISFVAVFALLGGILTAYIYASQSSNSYVQVLLKDRLSINGISTLNERSVIWKNISTYVVDHPLVPVGYYGAIDHWGVTGHSIFFTTLVEQGPIGVLVLFLFWAQFVLQLTIAFIRSRSRSTFMGLVGTVIIFINLLLEDPYFTQQYSIILWLSLAFMVMQAQESLKSKLDMAKGGKYI